jgi:hypothetical protein
LPAMRSWTVYSKTFFATFSPVQRIGVGDNLTELG